MNKLIAGLLMLSSVSVYASDIVSFDTPRINSHAISAMSNKDAVCKALIGEGSLYARGTYKRSGKVTQNKQGCLSTISKAYVVLIDESGNRTEGSIWHMGKRWVSKISCIKP